MNCFIFIFTVSSFILISYCPYCPILPSPYLHLLSLIYSIIRVTYTTLISRTMEYFLSFPDDAVERRKLGIEIQHCSSRPQLNQYIYPFRYATEGQLQTLSWHNEDCLSARAIIETILSDERLGLAIL